MHEHNYGWPDDARLFPFLSEFTLPHDEAHIRIWQKTNTFSRSFHPLTPEHAQVQNPPQTYFNRHHHPWLLFSPSISHTFTKPSRGTKTYIRTLILSGLQIWGRHQISYSR